MSVWANRTLRVAVAATALVAVPTWAQVRYTSRAAFTAAAGPLTTVYFQAAAPEPAVWGSMLIGFGTVGSLGRRRRSTRTATLAN